MRSILQAVRPDRQTLMFSATMPRRAEQLAAEALAGDALRVAVGVAGAGNAAVLQHVLARSSRSRLPPAPAPAPAPSPDHSSPPALSGGCLSAARCHCVA